MSDSISRQAAIDAINEYMVGKRCDTDGTMMARLINELVIKQLPPIQPKRGHWKHVDPMPEKMLGWMPWYCSECGVGVGKHQTAFCPNCGADMREVTT